MGRSPGGRETGDGARVLGLAIADCGARIRDCGLAGAPERRNLGLRDGGAERAGPCVGRPGGSYFTPTAAAGAYISVTYCLSMRRVEKRGRFERMASRTTLTQRVGTWLASRS